eukprot:112895-Pyramimonas_sp.AAC.2
MQSLSRCYAALAGNSPFTNDAMLGHSARAAHFCTALATANVNIFRIRPKLHPSERWNFRDEDSGGSAATLEFPRARMAKFMGQP